MTSAQTIAQETFHRAMEASRKDGECTCTECVQTRVIQMLCLELREKTKLIEEMEDERRLAAEVRPWAPERWLRVRYDLSRRELVRWRKEGRVRARVANRKKVSISVVDEERQIEKQCAGARVAPVVGR